MTQGLLDLETLNISRLVEPLYRARDPQPLTPPRSSAKRHISPITARTSFGLLQFPAG